MLGQSSQVIVNELNCQPTVFATSAANVLISHRGNVGLVAIDNRVNCQPTAFATGAANVMPVPAGQITITITE